MRVVTAAEIDGALSFPILIEALDEAFRGDIVVPVRHHHEIERAGSPGTLLLMPAWTGAASGNGYVGVKVVSVFPDNAARSLPSVFGAYLLMEGETGEPVAALDGTRLTVWRTAAASALAARHLAREDARRVAMVGAGALAPFLIRALMSVRPRTSSRRFAAPISSRAPRSRPPPSCAAHGSSQAAISTSWAPSI
jgi:ornithine cyclodeaminase/alanine dehydrogenase-like protein (mu-crystallin family)